ncbi:MAG: DUF6457 domain-containing protein [Jiangellaceae bacterium]
MRTWVNALCQELEVPVDDVDIDAILDLAKDAAHNVDRPAAPVTTFVVGYAAALRGGGGHAVTAATRTAAELARSWPPPGTETAE